MMLLTSLSAMDAGPAILGADPTGGGPAGLEGMGPAGPVGIAPGSGGMLAIIA